MTIERLAKLILAFGIVLGLCSRAWAPMGHGLGLKQGSVATVSGPSVPFTPLHLFFISTTGSDAANGLSPATAWATPNHTVNCGDVILAGPGTYTFGSVVPTVSNCPSTTGGIDGTGGIYFATILCASTLGNCIHNANWGVATNNLAVEGWYCSPGSGTRCYEASAGASGTTQWHHIAFINNICINTAQCFDCNEGALNHNVPGNGCDYMAAIGLIAQNASQDSICLSAIDVVAPSPVDSAAGTHYFIYNNYAWNNTSAPCVGSSDSEDFMFDTWDAHGFTGQGVVSNNIGYTAQREGMHLTYQGLNVSAPIIKIYNNTFYENDTNTGSDFADGEIDTGATASNPQWVVSIFNNIAQSTPATSAGGGAIYAAIWGGTLWSFLTVGGTGKENIFKSARTSCNTSSCDSGNNIGEFNGNSLGTNIYVDPGFSNVSDLITNRNGPPSCGGFTNTTACLGWNANSLTLTSPSIIGDLRPSASQAAGKGFQLPSTTCAANADYPTWLKGVVYLQASGYVTGATITENADLATKPCGM